MKSCKETQGLGKEMKIDRTLTKGEFLQALKLMEQHGTVINRRQFKAMMLTQMHFMGQNNDMAHITKDSLKACSRFPEFLTLKMKWSNVREDRDCPDQILILSMNQNSCTVLVLALFLEKRCYDGHGAISQWLFTEGTTDARLPMKIIKKEIECGKKQYSGLLTRYVLGKNGAFHQ